MHGGGAEGKGGGISFPSFEDIVALILLTTEESVAVLEL